MRRLSPPTDLADDPSNPFAAQPPASLRSLFDVSESQLPPIPHTGDTELLDAFDSAVRDIAHTDVLESTPCAPHNAKSLDLMRDEDQPTRPVFFSRESDRSNNSQRTANADRSKSFSGVNGEQLPIQKRVSPVQARTQSPGAFNRNRSASDGAFRMLGRTDSASSAPSLKRDSSAASSVSTALVAPSTPEHQRPDPFHANATAFYTPITPPGERCVNRAHKGSATSEESVMVSLRTQLALQQELAAQYEVNLKARDAVCEARG
jgi:hypothetical protein